MTDAPLFGKAVAKHLAAERDLAAADGKTAARLNAETIVGMQDALRAAEARVAVLTDALQECEEYLEDRFEPDSAIARLWSTVTFALYGPNPVPLRRKP